MCPEGKRSPTRVSDHRYQYIVHVRDLHIVVVPSSVAMENVLRSRPLVTLAWCATLACSRCMPKGWDSPNKLFPSFGTIDDTGDAARVSRPAGRWLTVYSGTRQHPPTAANRSVPAHTVVTLCKTGGSPFQKVPQPSAAL